MPNKVEKSYVMSNKITQVTIECTQEFMIKWLARGFEVLEIKTNDKDNMGNETIDVDTY